MRLLVPIAVAGLLGLLPDGGTEFGPASTKPEGDYEYYESMMGESRCTVKVRQLESGCKVVHSLTTYSFTKIVFADGKQGMKCGERDLFCGREFVCGCRPDAG